MSAKCKMKLIKREDLPVPQIFIEGDKARSDALAPDICACWQPKMKLRARKLLKSSHSIHCLDETAWAAMTAMSLDLLLHGYDVNAMLVKEFQVRP